MEDHVVRAALRATFNTLVLVGETPGREALSFKGFVDAKKW